MSDLSYKADWSTLPNPFSRIGTQSVTDHPLNKASDTSEIITGHASGRSSDIIDIVTGVQSALLLTGAPHIGKSTLLRYLARPPQSERSWRDELTQWRDQLKLNDFHFVLIDLAPLEGVEKKDDLLVCFIKQCAIALLSVNQPENKPLSALDTKKLPELMHDINQFLRDIRQEIPSARFFVVIDTVEYLGKHGIESSTLQEGVRAQQERGLVSLDQCGALRILVDLIDEFSNFGVILSTQSLPRSKVDDQFKLVSADLARFVTTTLQIFPWEDAQRLLKQKPESFEANWANAFRNLGGTCIFTEAEQHWILEQAGTHPYLLHQYCLRTFRYKQMYAAQFGNWTELKSRDQNIINEQTRERLSIFLAHFWQRLREALNDSSSETQQEFYDFIYQSAQKQAREEIKPAEWDQLNPELRYILCNEGIVRSDLFHPVHFPGSIVSQYLLLKVKENGAASSPPAALPSLPARGSRLIIKRPHEREERLSLTDLEFRLMKTLIEHAGHCTEDELIAGGWGRNIEHQTFTQRLFHLRKKLKALCGGIEIIQNHYGGAYTLNYLEWFTLE